MMTRPAIAVVACLAAGCALQPMVSLSGSAAAAPPAAPVPAPAPAPAPPAEASEMKRAALFVSAALFAGCALGQANLPIASDNAPTSQHGNHNRNTTTIYSADWVGDVLASVRELGIGILVLAGCAIVARSNKPIAEKLGHIGGKLDVISGRLDDALPRRRRPPAADPPPEDESGVLPRPARRPPASNGRSWALLLAILPTLWASGCGGMLLNVTPEGAVGIAESGAVTDSDIRMTWSELRPDGFRKDWTFERRNAVNEKVAVRLSKDVKNTLLAAQVLGFAAGLVPGGLPALFPAAAPAAQ